MADGLAGVECLSGIPGSVGATPIQNVGAYGQEVAETIAAVRVLDRATGAVATLPAGGLRLRLPLERVQAHARPLGRARGALRARARERSAPIRYAELARALGVALGDRAPLAAVRDAVLALRRGKGMVVDPADPDSVSAGSFFTNPVLDADAFAALERPCPSASATTRAARAPASPTGGQDLGRLAHRARGLPRGHGDPDGIAISAKHTLALTNRGAGTTAELVALAREIAGGRRDGVRGGAGARARVRRARRGTRRDVGQAVPRRGSRRSWR